MIATIALLNQHDDARACAEMLASSEPWRTLQVSIEAAVARLTDPYKEVYAARDEKGVAGFVILDMRGVFAGYIQTVCVRSDRRGQGIGTGLVRWAEERIFRDSPNVFMCVSSFNTEAWRLYERLGYERVGSLRGFIVAEHDEVLLRKTRGSWTDFHKSRRD